MSEHHSHDGQRKRNRVTARSQPRDAAQPDSLSEYPEAKQ